MKLILISLCTSLIYLSSCKDTKFPEPENESEIITHVTLSFISDIDTVSVQAVDPDGAGVEPLEILDTIKLQQNTTYLLNFSITNEEGSEIEDIDEEILEEGHEHQFFFTWTDGVFASNITTYLDEDINGLPIGLETSWTTNPVSITGEFKLVLTHIPNSKSEYSDEKSGDTDLDITFRIELI